VEQEGARGVLVEKCAPAATVFLRRRHWAIGKGNDRRRAVGTQEPARELVLGEAGVLEIWKII
jgi:hypothetical protein